ncbi:hypothetical protein WDU94_006027 [Cyamophila willieti]
MVDALEAVRMGQMSINQAAIHFNLPYSSLYGRFKRVKYEADHPEGGGDGSVIMDGHHPSPAPSNQSQSSVQSHHTTSQHGTPQPPQPPHTPHTPHTPQQQQQQKATTTTTNVSISTQHLTSQSASHLSHQPAQIMLVQYPAPGQLQMYQHSS